MRQFDFDPVARRQLDVAFEQQARSGDIVDLHLDTGAIMLHALGKQAELPARVLTLVGARRRWQKMSKNSHRLLWESAG
ncbi:hypothetical protein GCM10011393_39780 [Sphingopyxis bauzanensis]|nr:hypothetical protein GCM10011393_39780 [Sphingopyxis bauzanensis]